MSEFRGENVLEISEVQSALTLAGVRVGSIRNSSD
jgi:hypothetical protein